jgi:hypothetical protein
MPFMNSAAPKTFEITLGTSNAKLEGAMTMTNSIVAKSDSDREQRLNAYYGRKTPVLRTSYVDSFGNVEELEGESVKEIAEQLPEDYTGDLIVVDEAGFTRGYVHARNDWRAV